MEDGVRRFTGGPRPQGHLPRLISDLFGPFFRRPGIRGVFLYWAGLMGGFSILGFGDRTGNRHEMVLESFSRGNFGRFMEHF